jgi:hypothetical protein
MRPNRKTLPVEDPVQLNRVDATPSPVPDSTSLLASSPADVLDITYAQWPTSPI